MMNIVILFWMYVFLFAIVGGMRGWAKELLVSFSVIIALALNYLIFQFVPFVADLAATNAKVFFWLRTLTLLALVFFGYQTVALVPHLASRARREKVQDTILGIVFGGINGYLIAGTLLHYVHVANYPYPKVISAPTDPTLFEFVNRMMLLMPPQVFGVPLIYFVVILAFVFVIIVYI